MDDNGHATPSGPANASAPEVAQGDRRRRAREILSTQFSKLDRLEGELTERLQAVADEVARELTNNSDGAATGEALHESRVAALSEQVERLRADLSAREEAHNRALAAAEQARIEHGRLEQELRVRETLSAEAQSRDERTRAELAAITEQLGDAQSQLTALRERHDRLRQETAAEIEQLTTENGRSKSQRRRAAREFKQRHALQVAQLEEQQAQVAQLQAALAQATAEQERLVDQLRESAGPRGADVEELHKLRIERDGLAQGLAVAKEQLAELERLSAGLEKARFEAVNYEQELHVSEAVAAEARSQAERARVELTAAQGRLSDVEASLAAATARLAEAERRAGEIEHAKIETARLEQELRVRDAIVFEAQAREEQHRLEMVSLREQLAAAQSLAAGAGEQLGTVEQVRIETARFQQELRVREAELADARSHQESKRADLAAAIEQLHDVEAQLAAARQRQEELRREATAHQNELAKSETERSRLAESLTETQTEKQRLADELRKVSGAQATGADEAAQLRMRCEGLLEQIALGEQQRRELATAQGQIEELQVQLEASQASQAAAAAARIEAGKLEQELRVREALLAEAQTRQETCRVELATALEQLQDAQAQLALAHERQKELRREVAAAQNTARATDAGGSGGDGAELARMREALDAAHLQNHQLVGQLAETSAAGDTDELKKLRKERDTLKRKLAEVESKEGSRSAADEKNKDDLQRRFEMAVEDVRELKRANADLEAKLKSRGGAVASVAGGGGMDWEAQKQRMLASLEEDDRDDEDAVEERQSIENTIRITDQIVAQKDREIAALKRQLEDLGGNSTAVADLLDHDEIIRQEREKLVEVQTEWREKIGKAEIDISMERARIARERIELEEKLRNYQTERADRPPGETAAADDKPVRGRWLARLGLKDLNDES